jgi:hypothetical protein
MTGRQSPGALEQLVRFVAGPAIPGTIIAPAPCFAVELPARQGRALTAPAHVRNPKGAAAQLSVDFSQPPANPAL